MRIHRSASVLFVRWLALLGLADSMLRQKRRNAKWATLKVDETAAFLNVPKQQVRNMTTAVARGFGQRGRLRTCSSW